MNHGNRRSSQPPGAQTARRVDNPQRILFAGRRRASGSSSDSPNRCMATRKDRLSDACHARRGWQATTGYAFDELIYLRVIRMLRDDHGMPLELAVRSVKHIVDRCGPPGPAWAAARVFLDSGRVCLITDDDWPTTVANMGGQTLMEGLFGEEFEVMKTRADGLLVPTRFAEVVEIDPRVCDGQPCVRFAKVETGVIYKLSQRLSISRRHPRVIP